MLFILEVTFCTCVHVCVYACVCVCVSEHNVPSIHCSLLAKPDGAHQSKTPSRTAQLEFLNEKKGRYNSHNYVNWHRPHIYIETAFSF